LKLTFDGAEKTMVVWGGGTGARHTKACQADLDVIKR